VNGLNITFLGLPPFTSPISTPVPMPPSTPSQTGRPMFVMNTPVITAARVMPVPIDRSMPPVMMTKVVPRARIPITEVARRMPEMLLQVKKLFPKIEKKITRMIRVPNASDCWSCLFMRPTKPPDELFSSIAFWITVVVDGPGFWSVLILPPARARRTA
jgi:hypothetical protein